MSKYIPLILEECEQLFGKWKDINFDTEGNLLSYNIISKIMFGRDFMSEEKIDYINPYTYESNRVVFRDAIWDTE